MSQNFRDRFFLNLDAVYGWEGSSPWWGVSAMGRVVVSDLLRLSARVEEFSDPQGTRLLLVDDAGSALSAHVTEATLTAGIPLGQNAEVRPEIRYDLATRRVFGGGESHGQGTFQVAILGWL